MLYRVCKHLQLLFVMLLSVLMFDAVRELPSEDRERLDQGLLAELLYADDTLLLGVPSGSIERFLSAVSRAGATYGLELHWGKLQLLQVRPDAAVHRPDGSPIDGQEELMYLGSVMSQDGRVSKELARRLGMVHSDFRLLARAWRHSARLR